MSAQCDPCGSAGCGGVSGWSSIDVLSIGNEYKVKLCGDVGGCYNSNNAQACHYKYSWYSLGNGGTWTLNSDGSLSSTATGGIDYDDSCYGSSAAQSTINAICGTGDNSITVDSANVNCVWTFTFNSADLCSVGGGSGAKGGLSGGWIFIIILVVVTFVYCAGGVAFMRYRRGAVGMEMVPNIGFWRELPGLVKDGCRFSFDKVRACIGGARTGSLLSASTGSTYETI